MLRRSHFGPRHGSALVPVLVVAVAVSGLSAALVTTSLCRQSAARAEHERERAFEAAMTGLDVALYELQGGTDLGVDGIGTASGATEGCDWAVTVTPEFTGGGEYTLRSTGRHGRMRQAIELIVTSESPSRIGLFGRESVTTTGTFGTDSYDSTLGSYVSQVVGEHAGERGSIASNGGINLGSGVICGDATPGPGCQVSGDLSNVTGSTAPAPHPLDFPGFEYAPTVASTGPWRGSGAISAGTYRFDSLTLRAGAVLVINGTVSLSVDADFLVSGGSRIVVTPGSSLTLSHGTGRFSVTGGGIVNETQQPSQVMLRSASRGRIDFTGGTDYYGVIYAPEAAFATKGGTHFFGAVIGRSITANGLGGLHFDEALNLQDGGNAVFTVKSTCRIAAANL